LVSLSSAMVRSFSASTSLLMEAPCCCRYDTQAQQQGNAVCHGLCRMRLCASPACAA
jgi:hypothetical protein